MLTVDPDVSAADILASAVEKHMHCDSTMERRTYRLVYPDGQAVNDTDVQHSSVCGVQKLLKLNYEAHTHHRRSMPSRT